MSHLRQDRFQELRAAYFQRLESDREKLVGLKVRLRTDAGPALYDELGKLGHCMGGAAAVFEFPSIAALARRLEDTARAAARCRSAEADRDLHTALDALYRGVLAAV